MATNTGRYRPERKIDRNDDKNENPTASAGQR